ncbi:WD domain, G-beta repeat [Anatilimnocola aggregata]|uniref:WD domain, G-beta repeat n=1 Tax=Anatilimnocola aggregata TaxID=2528021 RepID=A0A517YIV2_9BACT|nr:hypothetical protein [Anatilimnocola aggregata]QDU30160.1 WD domain, G-beta repeat [Anatilimnocola aggregata]
MNIKNPKLLWQLTCEGSWPSAVAFVGSGQRVVAANQEGDIYLWDLPAEPGKFEAEKNSERKAPNHDPARKFIGHTNGVSRLRSTRDGKLLVSASLDHSVRIWDPAAAPSGTAEVILDGDQRRSKAKRDKKLEEQILKAPGIKVETVTAKHALAGHTDWVMALGMSGDEQRLISGDARSGVIVWDLPAAKEVARWTGLPWNWIRAAALSQDGKTALVSEQCDKHDDFDIPAAALRIHDATTGDVKFDILKINLSKYDTKATSYGSAQVWRKFVSAGLIAVDITPDGKFAVAGQGGENDTGKFHVIDMETGKVLREIGGHRYGVTDARFSADGKYLLSTGRDTTLRITNLEDGKEVGALGSPRGGQFKDWFSALAISPDEQTVAVADIAGLIQVWSLNS